MSGGLAGTLEDSCLSDVLNSSRRGSASVSRAIVRNQKKVAHFLWGWENKGQSIKHTQQTLREEKLQKRAISLCVKVLFF